MVNFRLSEDEYEYLKNLCLAEGARSVSDYARAAVCRSMAASEPGHEDLRVWVRILDAKVARLEGEFRSAGVLRPRDGVNVPVREAGHNHTAQNHNGESGSQAVGRDRARRIEAATVLPGGENHA